MVKYGIYDYIPCPIHSPSGCFMDGSRRIIKREKTSLCEQAPIDVFSLFIAWLVA